MGKSFTLTVPPEDESDHEHDPFSEDPYIKSVDPTPPRTEELYGSQIATIALEFQTAGDGQFEAGAKVISGGDTLGKSNFTLYGGESQTESVTFALPESVSAGDQFDLVVEGPFDGRSNNIDSLVSSSLSAALEEIDVELVTP